MWTFELQLRLISVFLSTFAIYLLTPRFSKALCHLTHYSTNTHPPTTTPFPLVSSSVSVCSCNASECVDRGFRAIVPVCMYMDVLLCHEIQGLIFMPFFFFNSKGKVYIALCCTGQCPKVNKFLIKYTWLASQPRVTWKTAFSGYFLNQVTYF